ncbi:MAG: hypothetical protein Fur0021_20280 [Candidatus Promineifilaceae bacterium]
MRVVVVGLGNPILGDDGVGWRVAEAVRAALPAAGTAAAAGTAVATVDGLEVEVDCLATGGLGLMERLIGYEWAIIVDAMQTEGGQAGRVTCFQMPALPHFATGHTSAAHDASLPAALQVGRAMGAELPARIDIVAIEAERVYDFSEELTPAVAAAIPQATAAVLNILGEWAGC